MIMSDVVRDVLAVSCLVLQAAEGCGLQMEHRGVPTPRPCTASLPAVRVMQACQQVLCSKADAFLEVCAAGSVPQQDERERCQDCFCEQVGKRCIKERGSTILFRPQPDPLATAQCYSAEAG